MVNLEMWHVISEDINEDSLTAGDEEGGAGW